MYIYIGRITEKTGYIIFLYKYIKESGIFFYTENFENDLTYKAEIWQVGSI